MTGDDLALVLEATDQAFAAVRKHLGRERPVSLRSIHRITKEGQHVKYHS